MNVMQEAFINGVSTRKIDKLAKSHGFETANMIERLNKEIQRRPK